MILIHVLLVLLFIYLASSVLYVFIFSLAGRTGSLRKFPCTDIHRRFAVLIPSYKEDGVIVESARQALNQTYPESQYDVIVIADSLKPETILTLKSLPVKVVEVSFEVSTKAKSLNKALEEFSDNYDYALVLDADNIMAPDFIEKINAVFVKTGVSILQGHRVAKNLNTNFAVLDAISEEINNHIFRKGHRIMGLSSALIGSGMAFEYHYFKKVMATNNAIGGFDRELELKSLRDGMRMEYVEDALVYDEKVEKAEVFQNQRRRWISAQVHYFRNYFLQGLWHLLSRGNVDFFDKAFQQCLLPRVLLLGTLLFFTLSSIAVEFIANSSLYPGVNLWMLILFIYIVALMMAIPDKFYNRRTVSATMSLPKAIVLLFLTLFKLKGANKKFIHTPHSAKVDPTVNSGKV